MSAGCGSSEGHILVPVPEATPEKPVPESTLSFLNECAERWADDLEARSYTIQFDLTITKHGGVSHVEPTGARLDVLDLAALADFTQGIALSEQLQYAYYLGSLYFFRADVLVALGRKAEARADLQHVGDDHVEWTTELRSKADILADCKR